MLKKKYYDGFTVHDILNKHLDDGHKILEILTAFADADGVDAVEVVRCKDCKYYEPDLYANPWGVCCHLGWIVNDTGNEVDENGYCYRAERKDDE